MVIRSILPLALRSVMRLLNLLSRDACDVSFQQSEGRPVD